MAKKKRLSKKELRNQKLIAEGKGYYIENPTEEEQKAIDELEEKEANEWKQRRDIERMALGPTEPYDAEEARKDDRYNRAMDEVFDIVIPQIDNMGFNESDADEIFTYFVVDMMDSVPESGAMQDEKEDEFIEPDDYEVAEYILQQCKSDSAFVIKRFDKQLQFYKKTRADYPNDNMSDIISHGIFNL